MDKLVEIRRLTVIAESSFQETLVRKFQEMGAKGYSCIDCSGAGQDEMMADPLTGQTHVQITVLATIPVAEAMLQHVHNMRRKKQKVIGYMEPVLVYEGDNFY